MLYVCLIGWLVLSTTPDHHRQNHIDLLELNSYYVMGDSESGVFDPLIPNGIILVSKEKLESFETIPNQATPNHTF